MQIDTGKDAEFPIIEDYVTVAITPLPVGWRNVYEQDDGTMDAEDCPAILLQELRGQHQLYVRDRNDRSFGTASEVFEPPYETREVFADNPYGKEGTLDVANQTSNYVGTIGPNDPLPKSKKKAA